MGVVLFIYNLINDTVKNSDFRLSYDCLISKNEQERKWALPNLRYCPEIRLQGLKKIINFPSQFS
jgi:hypothetical protein